MFDVNDIMGMLEVLLGTFVCIINYLNSLRTILMIRVNTTLMIRNVTMGK